MNLTINLSESNIAMLETRARAARMPTKDYLSLIVGCVLDRQRSQNAQNLANHLNEMATCPRHNARRNGSGSSSRPQPDSATTRMATMRIMWNSLYSPP